MFTPNSQASALAQISETAVNNFNLAGYTNNMLQIVQNPLHYSLSQVSDAYQFFQDMYNNTAYTDSNGNTIDFSSVPSSVASQMHTLVNQLLSDYDTINVPYDGKGDTAPLLIQNSDGSTSPASLLTLISNPDANYTIQFSFDEHDGLPGGNPSWSNLNDDFENSYDGSFFDVGIGTCIKEGFTSVDESFSVTKQVVNGNELNADQSTGLTANYDVAQCGSTANTTVSGSASDWENSQALKVTSSNTDQASTDLANLDEFFQLQF